MNVTIISILTGLLGTVTTELVKGIEDLEIRGQLETNNTIALLQYSEYWEKSLGLNETNFRERPSVNADVKNAQGVKQQQQQQQQQ